MFLIDHPHPTLNLTPRPHYVITQYIRHSHRWHVPHYIVAGTLEAQELIVMAVCSIPARSCQVLTGYRYILHSAKVTLGARILWVHFHLLFVRDNWQIAHHWRKCSLLNSRTLGTRASILLSPFLARRKHRLMDQRLRQWRCSAGGKTTINMVCFGQRKGKSWVSRWYQWRP